MMPMQEDFLKDGPFSEIARRLNSIEKFIRDLLLRGSGREVLSSARMYYVRADGNDGNTGLANTAAGAFLTVQKAITTASALDTSTYNITIQIGDGTYVSNTINCLNLLGSGTVTIQGNAGTPANVVIDGGYSKSTPGTIYIIKDQKLIKNAGSCATGIASQTGASIQFSNLDFGTGLTQHLYASTGGVLVATGNYTISGGASFHLASVNGGNIAVTGRTLTISGTPNFTGYFCYSATISLVQIATCTFNGAATGVRYNVILNSVIYTAAGGANYLPGNAAGAAATGGQYA